MSLLQITLKARPDTQGKQEDRMNSANFITSGLQPSVNIHKERHCSTHALLFLSSLVTGNFENTLYFTFQEVKCNSYGLYDGEKY